MSERPEPQEDPPFPELRYRPAVPSTETLANDERIRTAVPSLGTDSVYDHQGNPCVAWLTVDGRTLVLTHDDAWKLAWALIGYCVDHKQARAEARDE
jgi:hypothetical protein